MTIPIIVFAITGVFGGRGSVFPTKREGTLKKWLNKLVDALRKLGGKAFEALPAIVGNIAGTILSFLGKADGFDVKNTWALIAFVAGLIG